MRVLLEARDAGATSPPLDLDVDTGQAVLDSSLGAAGVDSEQAGAAAVNLQIDQGHRQEERSLDVDASERFGDPGEVLTLTTAGRHQRARPPGESTR